MSEQGSCCQNGCPNDCVPGYLFCLTCQERFGLLDTVRAPIAAPAWLEELELGCDVQEREVQRLQEAGFDDATPHMVVDTSTLRWLLALARKHYGGEETEARRSKGAE